MSKSVQKRLKCPKASKLSKSVQICVERCPTYHKESKAENFIRDFFLGHPVLSLLLQQEAGRIFFWNIYCEVFSASSPLQALTSSTDWNIYFYRKKHRYFKLTATLTYVLDNPVLVLIFSTKIIVKFTISSEAWRAPSPSQSPKDPPTSTVT